MAKTFPQSIQFTRCTIAIQFKLYDYTTSVITEFINKEGYLLIKLTGILYFIKLERLVFSKKTNYN